MVFPGPESRKSSGTRISLARSKLFSQRIETAASAKEHGMSEVVHDAIIKTREDVGRQNKDLLERCPLSRFVDAFATYPECAAYSYVSGTVQKLVSDIARAAGKDAACSYYKLLLLELISRNRGVVETSNLPDPIKRFYATNFTRILDDVDQSRLPSEFYSYGNDDFMKDLGVCNLRIIPAGAQKVHRENLPIGFLKCDGMRQVAAGTAYILWKVHGIGPFYSMHTDTHDAELMGEFSPSGWTRFYQNVAALMRVKRDVRGIFGIGWFFDPHLEQVSPRLNYLRDMVREGGGSIFRVGPSEGARTSALATSPTRRKLFEEQKYVPTDFMAVWDRRSLLRWASKSKASDGASGQA
jgi:hypothetical protein